MLIRALPAFLPALFLACPALAAETPSIALEPGSAGFWRVVYTLDEPAGALYLERNPDQSRTKMWRPENRRFELAHQAEGDVIRRKDGEAFTSVAFEMKARYAPMPKDYAAFSPFTDGGMLIHSGRLHACVDDANCSSVAGAPRWRISVTPPEGGHLIIQGAVRDGVSTFNDVGDGTNIYAGRATPLENGHFIAVIDAGLPLAVRDALYALLPPLMDYFTERLGPLQAKPMLFASLDPDPPKGSQFSSQGGTLTNQIFIHLYGEDWKKNAGSKLDGFLPWFFAHEAGHLFQAIADDGADPYNMDQSWIHEGGADAFAALAIADLGGAAPDYVEKRKGEAFDACAEGLRKLDSRPLNASSASGAFANYYACGLLMQLAIDAEARRASDGEHDLFDVWRVFLSRVHNGAAWDQDVFLGVATEGGAPSAAAFVRALATEPQKDPEAFLSDGLAAAGVEIRRPPR